MSTERPILYVQVYESDAPVFGVSISRCYETGIHLQTTPPEDPITVVHVKNDSVTLQLPGNNRRIAIHDPDEEDEGLGESLLGSLHSLLVKHFDEEEMRTLCLYLEIDYDSLRGSGKTNKVRELLWYLSRRQAVSKLIKMGQRLRKDIPWPK